MIIWCGTLPVELSEPLGGDHLRIEINPEGKCVYSTWESHLSVFEPRREN